MATREKIEIDCLNVGSRGFEQDWSKHSSRCRFKEMTSLLRVGCVLVFASNGAFSSPSPQLSAEAVKSAVRVESLTIPSPGEFFAAISKTGRPNWSEAGRSPVNLGASARPQIAMNLGTMVADGYLAVENQDGQQVKNIGRDIMAMAKKLNVGESVMARGKSIGDFAENNDWNALKEELEATQNEVKLTLMEQKDKDLVVLISLGAWLRGLEVATVMIPKKFSPEASALLRQPGVVSYFIDHIEALPENARKDEILMNIHGRMLKILEAIQVDPSHEFSKEEVEALRALTVPAVEVIVTDTEVKKAAETPAPTESSKP